MIIKKKVLITVMVFLSTCFSYGQVFVSILDTLGADSLIQVFYQKDKLFYQVSYKNGVENGWYEQYHENGLVFSKEFRVDGKTIDGFYIYLNKNGGIYQEGYLKNGVPVGRWYTYDSFGKVVKIFFYKKNGILKKIRVCDNEIK